MLYWYENDKLRSQFNRLFRLGVVHLGDVVDNESQRLSEFEDVKRWLYITLVPWSFVIENKCCTLGGLVVLQDGTCLLQVTKNILYHHAMASLAWLSPQAEKVCHVCKLNECKVVENITTWLAFPFAILCKGIQMESHERWAPIWFNLKEMRSRVRYMLLLHHSIGRQFT